MQTKAFNLDDTEIRAIHYLSAQASHQMLAHELRRWRWPWQRPDYGRAARESIAFARALLAELAEVKA